MTDQTKTLDDARTALARAMDRAGVSTDLTLVTGTKQSDWRDYCGIAVLGPDAATVERAAAWLAQWADRHMSPRDSDGNRHRAWATSPSTTDEYGRVDFSVDVPLADRPALPPVRALVVTRSYKIGN